MFTVRATVLFPLACCTCLIKVVLLCFTYWVSEVAWVQILYPNRVQQGYKNTHTKHTHTHTHTDTHSWSWSCTRGSRQSETERCARRCTGGVMDYSRLTLTTFPRDIKEESSNNQCLSVCVLRACVCVCVCASVTHSRNLFGYRSVRIREHKLCPRVLS